MLQAKDFRANWYITHWSWLCAKESKKIRTSFPIAKGKQCLKYDFSYLKGNQFHSKIGRLKCRIYYHIYQYIYLYKYIHISCYLNMLSKSKSFTSLQHLSHILPGNTLKLKTLCVFLLIQTEIGIKWSSNIIL
jgi:hypothetical protein